MTQKLRILISECTNPWFNLATEDWIFRELDPDCHTLYLWRNAETVVIGRYQNPWAECKTDIMEQDNVYLARRQSGGGAVFHDLGNTNFTFLSPKKGYDQEANFNIIINALASLGISAHNSGRNDLLVGEQKVSGSAFKHGKDRCFHHGTLLISANMAKLANYLNPHPLKLQAKGITSVRSRVANLSEFNKALNHDNVCSAIIDSFCKYYGSSAEVEILNEDVLAQYDSLKKYYDCMADWDWRFGKTPEFTHTLETRFDWGIVTLHINVEQAHIKNVTIFSDALDVAFIEALQEHLQQVPYNTSAITDSLHGFADTNTHWHKEITDLQEWMVTQVH